MWLNFPSDLLKRNVRPSIVALLFFSLTKSAHCSPDRGSGNNQISIKSSNLVEDDATSRITRYSYLHDQGSQLFMAIKDGDFNTVESILNDNPFLIDQTRIENDYTPSQKNSFSASGWLGGFRASGFRASRKEPLGVIHKLRNTFLGNYRPLPHPHRNAFLA